MSTNLEVTEVSVSSVGATADPAPLGLAAFAMTTFVLSVFNADRKSVV